MYLSVFRFHEVFDSRVKDVRTTSFHECNHRCLSAIDLLLLNGLHSSCEENSPITHSYFSSSNTMLTWFDCLNSRKSVCCECQHPLLISSLCQACYHFLKKETPNTITIISWAYIMITHSKPCFQFPECSYSPFSEFQPSIHFSIVLRMVSFRNYENASTRRTCSSFTGFIVAAWRKRMSFLWRSRTGGTDGDQQITDGDTKSSTHSSTWSKTSEQLKGFRWIHHHPFRHKELIQGDKKGSSPKLE